MLDLHVHSPLQCAASLGDLSTVVLLRSHGASVAMAMKGVGPVHEASANGHHGMDIYNYFFYIY